jgi:hypothetical protein
MFYLFLQEICHEDETKQLKLHRGDDVSLSLWMSANLSEVDLSCSFWCEEVGSGGRGRGDLDAEEDMLASLVSSQIFCHH